MKKKSSHAISNKLELQDYLEPSMLRCYLRENDTGYNLPVPTVVIFSLLVS